MNFETIRSSFKQDEEQLLATFNQHFNPLLGKQPTINDVMQLMDLRRGQLNTAVMLMLDRLVAIEKQQTGAANDEQLGTKDGTEKSPHRGRIEIAKS